MPVRPLVSKCELVTPPSMKTSTDGAPAACALAGSGSPDAPSVSGEPEVAPASSRPLPATHASTLIALAISALALALHFTPHAADLLQFDRTAIAHGELWRLLTGPLVHFDRSHLLWDIGAFAVLASLLRTLSWRRWLVLLLGGSLAISLGVLVLPPHFEIYRGLSGLDSALFAAALALRWRQARLNHDRPAALLLATLATLFLAKCGYESATHGALFDNAALYTPTPTAHLFGAITGAACVLKLPFCFAPRGHPR